MVSIVGAPIQPAEGATPDAVLDPVVTRNRTSGVECSLGAVPQMLELFGMHAAMHSCNLSGRGRCTQDY